MLIQHRLPRVFCKGSFDEQTRECLIEEEADHLQKSVPPTFTHVIRVLVVCPALWGIVMGVVWKMAG
ncbi:hypothetical protein [uncultured Desulfosarcina sp.]|uniref:hypothetical protein n=1 Tax=uncultured Desulfosarcina sp. TaxID=218289 RepID=UPI0029C97357|nr:hypothetical protein [uncultured Desulfosarcina sp.]